jgi:hypothetical protein
VVTTPKWAALKRMTDQELIEKYDSLSMNTVVGLAHYEDLAAGHVLSG